MDSKIEINADELPNIRVKLMKSKIIALDAMDKHPLLNPKYFNKKDKEELLKKVRYIFDTNDDYSIDTKFNDICNEKLFSYGTDYSNYPIYVDRRFTEQQKKIDDEEPDLDKLKEEIKIRVCS
jgi:hypothetical protein